MTFSEKFESLRKSFVKADKKKLNGDFAVQITMSDEDCGGTFYIEYKEGTLSVEPFDYYDNTAYINASAASVAKLAKGVVATDLNVGGNEEIVKMLATAYKASVKKAVKKTVTKKAETKKEVKTVEKKTACAAKADVAEKETKPVAKKETKSAAKKEAKPTTKTVTKTAGKKASK